MCRKRFLLRDGRFGTDLPSPGTARLPLACSPPRTADPASPGEQRGVEVDAEHLRALLADTTDLAAVLDAEGKLRYLNRAGRRLLVLSTELDARPLSAFEVVAEDGSRSSGAHPTIFALRARHCRFPLGSFREPAVFFCGKPALWPKPYCRDCCQRAYVTLRAR